MADGPRVIGPAAGLPERPTDCEGWAGATFGRDAQLPLPATLGREPPGIALRPTEPGLPMPPLGALRMPALGAAPRPENAPEGAWLTDGARLIEGAARLTDGD